MRALALPGRVREEEVEPEAEQRERVGLELLRIRGAEAVRGRHAGDDGQLVRVDELAGSGEAGLTTRTHRPRRCVVCPLLAV